jgi:hypothetical protein
MSATTAHPRHLRVDVTEKRLDIAHLVRDEDQPLDRVGDDPDQLGTLVVLLDAAHSLLKHVEAIAEHDGASLSRQELALVRVMIGELDGVAVDVDDLRLAVHELMRPAEEA